MKRLGKLKLKEYHEMDDMEMKHVLGGYVSAHIDGIGSGTCGAFIPIAGATSYSIPHPSMGNLTSGSFTAGNVSGTTQSTTWKGISKDIALQMTQGLAGAKWCCDNCSSASWY